MKILIDTHVMVWLIDGSSRLGPTTKKLLADSANQIFVSYLSPFEIAIKATTGKIAYSDRVFDALADAGITVLYPGREILKAYRLYNPANKDPFDNALLAVAEVESAAFMTSDTKILATSLTAIKLIDARL